MAPRGQTLPQATTESAREARKSFFCELCQKGYARMNDFEAHEGSYDHQHRKRLKEMRQLTKDPNAAAKAREAERKANEEAGLKSIDIASLAQPGAKMKKKPVFKSTLQPHNAAVLGVQPAAGSNTETKSGPEDEGDEAYDIDDPDQARANGWEAERYDPSMRVPRSECEMCGGGMCRKVSSERQTEGVDEMEDVLQSVEEDPAQTREQIETQGLARERAVGSWWKKGFRRPLKKGCKV